MAHGVSTEWEDIQVKMGNYLPREKEATNDDIEKIAIETLEKYDPLEKKTLEELKDFEDDEDDEVLKEYQNRRLKELQEYAKKPKFGTVTELRKQDYIAQVTNAPKDVFVVLHLYQTYVEASNVLAKIFENLAKKFPLVKFMQIVATNCVDNFKDNDVPGVIIYKNSQMIRQFIPANYYFGGKNLSWKKVEWILSSLGVVKSELQEDPFDEQEHTYINKIDKSKRDDESDEDDRDDREFSWKINKK